MSVHIFWRKNKAKFSAMSLRLVPWQLHSESRSPWPSQLWPASSLRMDSWNVFAYDGFRPIMQITALDWSIDGVVSSIFRQQFCSKRFFGKVAGHLLLHSSRSCSSQENDFSVWPPHFAWTLFFKSKYAFRWSAGQIKRVWLVMSLTAILLPW